MNMEHLLAATKKVVELNNQLTAVTEQRDALAEALRIIEKDDVLGWAGDLASKALATITK